MNKQDIIRMAREAGFDDFAIGVRQELLERFAALVMSAECDRLTDFAIQAAEKSVDVAIALEREACAKVCEDMNSMSDYYALRVELICANAIRARGQA